MPISDLFLSSIAASLETVYSRVLESGVYPKCWEEANITPLKKKPNGDLGDLKNLCPISLLPTPAKILEKHINQNLAQFLTDRELLDPSQNRFRRNHSTESALIAAADPIHCQVDQGGAAILVTLDLTADFDTIFPSLLVQRLQQVGLRDFASNLLETFLVNRTQTVSCGDFEAKSFQLPCGVPQGSSLSPTSFNLWAQFRCQAESHPTASQMLSDRHRWFL